MKEYITPESVRAYKKRYYQAHREELLEKAKKYRQAHKEERKEYQKKYSMTHDLSEYQRQYYQAKRERLKTEDDVAKEVGVC